MALISHPNQVDSNPNPAKRFLDWKSNEQCFSYYDKEIAATIADPEEKKEKANVCVALPTKFLLLEHYHTVKGWNDASSSGIYSNEVKFIGSEPLSVKSFKGGLIAEGIYKEQFDKIQRAGGKYHRSLYVMTPDGEIVNISLKGSGVSEWSEFHKANKHLLDGQWIEVNEAKSMKKGSNTYSVPVFTMGKPLTSKEAVLVDAAVSEFQVFVNDRFKQDAEPVAAGDDDDDLDLGDLGV